MTAPDRHRLLVGLLFAALAALMVGRLWHKTLTYDEPDHLRYGLNLLHGDPDRFDDSKMPVSALNALPKRIAEGLPPGRLAALLESAFAARLATMSGTLLLALLVLVWTRELYGRAAGLLALALIAFDPNLIAHGRLATTDLWGTLTLTAAVWLTWRFVRIPTFARGVAAALAFGIAQLAKYSNVFLVAILPALALVSLAPAAIAAARERRWRALATGTGRFLGWILLFGLTTLAVLNLGYLFRRTLTPFDEYRFRSAIFRELQAEAPPALAGLPVPTPYPWLEGLDWVVSRERRERGGEGFGNVYLFGELRRDEGFVGYYLWAYLFKVPLPTQLLFLIALGTYVAGRRRFRFLRDEVWILGPVAFFFVYLNVFFQAQMGIRYLIVAFPLMHVFTGSLLASPETLPRSARPALGVALAWLVLSVLSYFPHYLSYMNELVPDRTRAYELLSDSNLDWGQNDWWLARWLEAHPEAIVEPEGPVAGTVVVRVNFLTGVLRKSQFRWLRNYMEPVDDVAYSYLVYEVSEEDLRRLPDRLRPPGLAPLPEPRAASADRR